MADEPGTGEMPAQDRPAGAGETPPQPTQSVAAEPAGETPEDDFDRDRAMATIRKQREDLKAAKAAAAQAAELQKRLEALENERLTEEQKRQKTFEQTQSRLAELEHEQLSWQRERQEILSRQAVERAAMRAVTDGKGAVTRPAFIDPSDAYALLDLAALEYDDDGRPVNVDKLLAELAKAKPHLVQAPAGTGTVAAGSPSNPPRGRATDAPPKTQAQQYADVFGPAVDIFDPQAAARWGGGVRPPGE